LTYVSIRNRERKKEKETGETLQTEYGYDSSNRLEVLSHQRNNSGTILSDYLFGYDQMNRITSINHTVGVGAGPGSAADGLSSISYDKASQLLAADHAPARPDENYQFDANGNRTGSSYQNGSNNQTLVNNNATYQYDKEGNRTRVTLGPQPGGGNAYDEYFYDHRNRLVQVKKWAPQSPNAYEFANYTYDSFNRMVKQQTGTYDVRNAKNTFTRDQYFAGYEGINPTLHFETTGTQSAPAATESNLKNRYLWGPQVDQLLADEQYGSTAGGASSPASGPGNTLWALADHLGTIRDIADFDTAANPGVFSIVNHRVFDSFGNLTSQTSASASASIAFRYTGKYFDSLTGLSHHWNRWYDPKLGKWISEDPIGFAGGDANLSRYVGNAVHNFVDSNGLIQDPVQENDDRPIEGTLILPKGDKPLFNPMVGMEQPEIGPIGQTLPDGFVLDSPYMNLPMPGPLVESTQTTGGWGDWIWGGVHNTLDVAGFFPGAGAIPDLINATLHGARGNYTEAGTSLVAMIPFFGDGVKAVDKANDVRKGIQKLAPVRGAIRPVGQYMESINDVLANPQLLNGKTAAEVQAVLGKTPGWSVETLGKGAHQGQGWVLREYNAAGNQTGRMLRWHPGGGHHGPNPYWRVNTHNTKSPIIPAGPES
jgi:RHS repeat-associated protein